MRSGSSGSDRPTIQRKKGTGSFLGTMVIFSIIRGMNGHIEVQSKEGAGTTYLLRLPLHGR